MKNISSPPVFCIMGPTASGKTALACELLQDFPFQIISVDSAMVYRGLDIGTAKPDKNTLAKAPHLLIDIRDPLETYSAADFCQDANQAIEITLKNKQIPLLVGGTMLYFRALQFGLSTLPKANPAIRQRLSDEAKKIGWPALHQRLQKIDPLSAEQIDPHDTQRLQRALEIFELTGQSRSTLWQQSRTQSPYQFINIALKPSDRQKLHETIAQRFDLMLAEGFSDEVNRLYQRGDLHENLPALKTVGYRQMWQYLDGKYDFTTMREKALAATRQLAKRQITWLSAFDSPYIFESTENPIHQKVTQLIKAFF